MWYTFCRAYSFTVVLRRNRTYFTRPPSVAVCRSCPLNGAIRRKLQEKKTRETNITTVAMILPSLHPPTSHPADRPIISFGKWCVGQLANWQNWKSRQQSSVVGHNMRVSALTSRLFKPTLGAPIRISRAHSCWTNPRPFDPYRNSHYATSWTISI